MQYTWRPTLRKNIEERYTQNSQEWYELIICTSGLLNITIISERFVNIPPSQRREQILDLLRESDAPTAIGFLSLYTLNAADLGPDQNFRNLFQKTTDFEHFLNDTTCLIRGRKGTGKTALYVLLLRHKVVADELSNKRLNRVVYLGMVASANVRPEGISMKSANS